MPPTRAESRAAHRTALLDAARVLVTQDGAGVPLARIAAAAGLTTGAVYSIFGSKSELLVALVRENVARAEPHLPDLTGDPSLASVVDGYVQAWLTGFGDDELRHNAFELQVLLEAAQDDRLTARLGAWADEETARVADLLTGRRTPQGTRTTAQQARALASSLQAVLAGFGVRAAVQRQDPGLVRRTCAALVPATLS